MISVLIGSMSCSDWVSSVDPLIHLVESSLLTDENQMEFVRKGVLGRFQSQVNTWNLNMSLFSDEGIFDSNIPLATYPSYNIYDQNQDFQINYGDGTWSSMHRTRYLAEDMLRRCDEIGTFEDQNLEKMCRFWGNFTAGYVRYNMTVYTAVNPEEPGGILSTQDEPGTFMTAAAIYPLAMTYYNAALTLSPDAAHTKLVNLFIARQHLFMGDYSGARSAAALSFVEGDADYTLNFDQNHSNALYYYQGFGRTQGAMAFRFHDYLIEDPKEGYVREDDEFSFDFDLLPTEPGVYDVGRSEPYRLPMWRIRGIDDLMWFYIQDKWKDRGDDLIVGHWKEVALILAELDIRDGDPTSAITRINAVRASFLLDPKVEADLIPTISIKRYMNDGTVDPVYSPTTGTFSKLLIEERDKTLMLMGMRQIDQLRFGIWHMPAGRQFYQHKGWLYWPIGEQERDRNPNIPTWVGH